MVLRNLLFALVAASVALPVRAVAQDHDPPLFAAFKRFCIHAGGDANEVKRAVEAAGGTPHNPLGGASVMPWPKTAESWDIVVQGHKMILNIGMSHRQRGPNTANCMLNSSSDERAGIAALRRWVGVPQSFGSDRVEIYSFEQDGAVRRPGRGWQLTIMPHANSLQLSHAVAAGRGKAG